MSWLTLKQVDDFYKRRAARVALTREEISEMYTESQKVKIKESMKPDTETAEFELSVKVTNKKITVDCKFPDGHLSGSGSLELVGPYIAEALNELQKKMGKG